MLNRQKVILALLSQTKKPLNPTMLVKLAFLLRHETELANEPTFYDFVPYKFGPFSFALYRELDNLRRNGYIKPDDDTIALCEYNADIVEEKIGELNSSALQSVDSVVKRYGKLGTRKLLENVYLKYPWYASRSELTDLRPILSKPVVNAKTAVYTLGYEGLSVDLFFNHLLEQGIKLIVDVRAKPISRRYGFSKRQICEIGRKLGLDYCHLPNLGIPGKLRVNLNSFDDYQRLLKHYERKMLPNLKNEVKELANLMQETVSVLVCVEKDIRCCHRSRLADAVSKISKLKVVHL